MRNVIVILLSVFLALSCANYSPSPDSCIRGKGKIVTQTRDVKNFTQITLKGGFDLVLTYSKNFSVKVKDHQNLLPHIVTQVSGNTLQIYFDHCVCCSDATVYVSMPKIEKIVDYGSGDIKISGNFEKSDLLQVNVLGSGDITIDSQLAKEAKIDVVGSGDVDIRSAVADVLKLSLAGSGDVDINLNSNVSSVVLKTVGSGDISLKGQHCNKLQIKSVASGDVDADEIKADTVIVSSSGSGDIEVWALKQLKVKSLGSGDVEYKGNPSDVEINALGSGEVERNGK